MTSTAHSEPQAPTWAAIAFGVWAAAVAFQPLLAAPAAAIVLVWWTIRTPVRWLGLFLAAALLLPPLPIPIGDSGPHPCLIFAGLGLFAGWLRLADWRIAPSGLAAAFTALFGILLASVAAAAVYSGEVAAAGSAARVMLFGI